MKIVAVGECTIDRYVDIGVERAGGISLNFAVNAKASGAESVALVSSAGLQAEALVRAKLIGARVDPSHLYFETGPTATQIIRIAPGGERVFPPGGYDPGVLAGFQLSDEDQTFIRTFDVVAFPLFRQIEPLVSALLVRVPGQLRVVDLLDGSDLGSDFRGVERLLAVADILFVSGDERTVERLGDRYRSARPIFVVTRGAAGSTALRRGERFDQSAVPVPIAERLDSTGCGDAFQAAFTVEYYRSGDLSRSLAAGAERAATVIRHIGATAE